MKLLDWEQDLVGSRGWRDLAQLFAAMNACVPYVVLRNFEGLPHEHRQEEHSDIDFLVGDLHSAVTVMRARKVFAEDWRVHYAVPVGGKPLLVDLRHVGDEYYDQSWQRDMLASRVMNANGIHVPCAEHYYHALACHALFHKRSIASDYPSKLAIARRQVFPDSGETGFADYLADVHGFVRQRAYRLTRPRDRSVYWDGRYDYRLGEVQRARADFGVTHVTAFACREAKANLHSPGQVYFKAMQEETGKPLFMKWGGLFDAYKHQFHLLKRLHSHAPEHFPEPAFYARTQSGPVLAMELLEQSATGPENLDVDADLVGIADALYACGIVHRNILPEHLLRTRKGFMLVDFSLAVDGQVPSTPEREIFGMSEQEAARLGHPHNPAPGHWDDAHSLFAVACKGYGIPPRMLVRLRSRIGRMQVAMRAGEDS